MELNKLNSKECAIFTGGEFEGYESIDVSKLKNKTIISADAGYIHAKKLGLKTNIAIGDFDTLEEIPRDVDEVIKFPKEKDDTDTMLAVKLALERGFDDIELYGALGGRLDHTFANIQTLAFISKHNASGRIISDSEIILFTENEGLSVEKREGFSLSIFSFGDVCEGVTLRGVKYPLTNATVTQSFPIGVCNEIIEKRAEISLKRGKMLIIISKK